MSIKNVELFQKVIIQDVALQDKLKESTTGLESFAKRVVQLGKEAGYYFTVEEVKAVSTKRKKTAAMKRVKKKEVLIPGIAWSPRGLENKEVLIPGIAWSPRGLDQALPV